MIGWIDRHRTTWFLGSLLFIPFALFALRILDVMYFLLALIVAIYVSLFIVNFEVGFLTLICIRSSLDYLKGSTGESVVTIAAAVSVLFIVLGVFYILYRKINVFRYQETPPFLILLGFTGISVFGSSNLLLSISEWLRLVSVFFVYVLARATYTTEKKIKLALLIVLVSTLVPVVVAGIQYIQGNEEMGRLRGTFIHPNGFATYLMIVIIYCLPQVFERKTFLNRSAVLTLLVPMLLVFVLTLSIGAWIVFVIALVFLGLLRYRWLLWLIPFIPLFLFLLVPPARDRIMDIFDPLFARGHSSWEWRLMAWKDMLPLIKRRLFFGHGPGMVEVEMGYPAHNDYLKLLAEVGVFGLLAYLNLAFCMLKKTWHDLRTARTDLIKSFQVALLAVVLGILVRQFADNTLRNTVIMIYLWVFVALARNLWAAERGQGRQVL